LTIVLDAPVALDYLGCSGRDLQQDVRTIADALRGIGCSFVVFPTTCVEMRRNLESMLALPAPKRHGYTHEALCRGEVLQDFVVAVARNPEQALEAAGVQVKPITLDQFPHQHVHFSEEQYEDFLASITWVQDIAPREHDAACMTLLMRLREGRHNSDLFRCGYAFVTRNPAFVRQSRAYCVQARLINAMQQGPIIHQRELATIAWLRTGLGAALDIPRSHLIATCDRVLRLRTEVQEAVASKLRQVTPEKLEQFELLIQDHRGIRKLADETLNDEKVVTAENAARLLEAMRQATIAKEKEEFEKMLQEQATRHKKVQQGSRAEINRISAELDEVRRSLARTEARDYNKVDRLIKQTNRRTRRIEVVVTFLLLLLGVLGIVDFFTGWLTESLVWKGILALAGLLGLYHLISHLLQKPIVGLPTVLTLVARAIFLGAIRRRDMEDQFELEKVEFKDGNVNWRQKPTQSGSPPTLV
jgi:hypothetical protein